MPLNQVPVGIGCNTLPIAAYQSGGNARVRSRYPDPEPISEEVAEVALAKIRMCLFRADQAGAIQAIKDAFSDHAQILADLQATREKAKYTKPGPLQTIQAQVARKYARRANHGT